MQQCFSTIAVAPVWALEPGDLISMEFIGSFISGRIESIPYSWRHLTEGQIEYLKTQHVKLDNKDDPAEYWKPLGGSSQRLLFGDFYSPGVNYKHMFVDRDKNVAVFLKNKD